MDLILKNGILVTSEEMYQADIGISGEKIAAIGTDLQDNTSKIIDVTGKFILPGAIDAHTHMAMPLEELSHLMVIYQEQKRRRAVVSQRL